MWRAESGAGKVEYAAVVLVVAGIVTTVLAFGLPGDVRGLYERALCLLPGDEECAEVVAGGEPKSGDSEDGGDGSGDEESEGDDEGGEQEGGSNGDSGGGDSGEAGEAESGGGGEEVAYDPELAQNLEDAESELEEAEEEVAEAESAYEELDEELLQLLKELIGLADAERCLTEGDVVACLWTVAEFIPWAKAGKLIRKIPDIAGMVTKWRRRSRKLDNAEERADTARRDRDQALKECETGPGNNRGGNSFAGDTPVLLAGGGTQPIAEMDTGDYVVAADPETGMVAPRPVTDTITGAGEKDLVTLTVLTGHGGEEITATEHHRFWDEGNRQWVRAEALRPGDQLRTPDDDTVTVAGLSEFSQRQTVHNLTVHDLHTYHVSTGGTSVLVHNQNNDSPCYPPQTISDRSLDHSFDRHAEQWFGREVTKEAKREEWRGLIEQASRSNKIVPWKSGSTKTNAYLTKIDGKWFAAQYDKQGNFLTAFVPNQKQVTAMQDLLHS